MNNQAAQTMPSLVDRVRECHAAWAAYNAVAPGEDRAVGTEKLLTEVLAALSQTAGVPDARPALKYDDEGNGEYNYNMGWNDCRAAMLAAAPSASGGERVPLSERLYRGPAHDPSGSERGLEPQATSESMPPSAASVSEWARSLLAQAYHDGGFPFAAETLLSGRTDSLDECALGAIEQALTQQRGECVDAAGVLRWAASILYMWEGDPNETGYMGDFRDAEQILHLLADHATTTPQPGAEVLRELVRRILDWQPLTSINKADRLYQILVAAGLPFESVTDELESLLGRGGK